MKSRISYLTLVAPLAAVAVIATSAQTPPQAARPEISPFLKFPDGRAYLVGPKKHLLDGQIDQVNVSPDGSHALVVHRTQSPKTYLDSLKGAPADPRTQKLTLVNGQTGKTVEFKLDLSQITVFNIEVFNTGTSIITALVEGKNSLILATAQGRAAVLLQNDPDQGEQFQVAPLHPGGQFLIETSTRDRERFGVINRSNLALYSPDGRKLREWQNSHATIGSLTPYMPTRDNTVAMSRPNDMVLFNPLNESVTPLPEDLLFASRQGPTVSHISRHTADIATVNLFDETHGTMSTTAPVGVFATATPATDKLHVYLHDSAGLYRLELIPADPKEVEDWEKEKIKAETINRAKQVGVAILIYSADYDDMFPPNQDFSDRLLPYLKNADVLNGFNYLFSSQDWNKIKDPANTVIGIISTPYGEAVLRADTSVVWRDRP